MTTFLDHDPQARRLADALGSQYEVVRLLGRGGMGVVYLAREPFLDREVAVKVLPAELASGDARERFLREARTAARLSHPHIVPLHTFGQAGDLLFYVMGYVEGESLEARLRREGRLPVDDARRIIDEISDALQYAHAMGVVHRDVKPDNILIDRRTGRAMLTDFGIAKVPATAATLTRTGMIVGTPHYMSPEQAAGTGDIDGRSDIYALGVIAYRMVTGQLPFEGETAQQVLSQHAVRVPLAPSKIVPDLPFELDRVIVRALAKNPAERWPTAAAMRQSMNDESDEAVPDDLRSIAGVGPRLLLTGYGIVQLGILMAVTGVLADNPIPLRSFGWGFVFTQVVGALSWIRPWRRWGRAPTLRAYWQQPNIWVGWWPRAWRRAGDVYDRLPDVIRIPRVMSGGSVLMLPLYANLVMYALRPSYMLAHQRRSVWLGIYGPMIVLAALMAPMVWYGTRLRKWARARGFSPLDRTRLVSESTFNLRFWQRPDVAVLLSTRSARAESHRAGALDDLERIARGAGDSPYAATFREAAEAGRVLQAAIESIEVELAQLLRDGAPAEHQRIKESLDALGDETVDDRPAKQQMRTLLRQQLQLFEQIATRSVEVRETRDRLLEQLRTLGMHVAHLRAEANAARATTLSERIHTVCDEVARHASAIRETERMLTPG